MLLSSPLFWSGRHPYQSLHACCMLSRFSHVRLCVTLWTAAHQAPLSTGFSRQEYWNGLPFPSPTNPYHYSSGMHSLLLCTLTQVAAYPPRMPTPSSLPNKSYTPFSTNLEPTSSPANPSTPFH